MSIVSALTVLDEHYDRAIQGRHSGYLVKIFNRVQERDKKPQVMFVEDVVFGRPLPASRPGMHNTEVFLHWTKAEGKTTPKILTAGFPVGYNRIEMNKFFDFGAGFYAFKRPKTTGELFMMLYRALYSVQKAEFPMTEDDVIDEAIADDATEVVIEAHPDCIELFGSVKISLSNPVMFTVTKEAVS